MPQSSTYPIGETVTVTLNAAVVTVADPLTVQLGGETVVVPGDPGVDLKVVQPANWPPQSGDVWTDVDGTKWFGVEGGTPVKVLLVAETGGDPVPAQQVKQQHRPLTLTFRAA